MWLDCILEGVMAVKTHQMKGGIKMTDYDFENKKAFNISGIGVELTSDYMDQEGLNREKEDFFNRMIQDGAVAKLKEVAKNDYLFVINEAVDDKMMHYVGVETNQKLPEATHTVQFPEGKYIVIPGEAKSQYELADTLTKRSFGDVLQKETEYGYVGGPNTAVIMGEADGVFVGEMWLPVVKQ